MPNSFALQTPTPVPWWTGIRPPPGWIRPDPLFSSRTKEASRWLSGVTRTHRATPGYILQCAQRERRLGELAEDDTLGRDQVRLAVLQAIIDGDSVLKLAQDKGD